MTEQYEYASTRVEMASDATLRDYLAAKAMQPMITYFGEQAFSDYSMNEISEEAYRMADAMLKARG